MRVDAIEVPRRARTCVPVGDQPLSALRHSARWYNQGPKEMPCHFFPTSSTPPQQQLARA